jgi:histidine triad (HIT) family protein
METFEDVVRGVRDVQRIHEDERHLAFLSPEPVRAGHVIVLPKKVSDYLFDLKDEPYHALWDFARTVARRMRERLPCERVCTAVIGWQVRHVHIHLIPTDAAGQFPPLPGSPMTRDELAEIARRLV